MVSGTEATWGRTGDCATRTIAGETILVPIRSGFADLECVFTLDEVGSFIWGALATPQSAGEVAALVAAEFDVSSRDALADVQRFLAELEEARLVACGGA